MDVRTGFSRLYQGFLVLVWVVGGISTAFDDPSVEGFVRMGGMLLVFTVVFVLFCKLVAWVYNGFSPRP